MPCLLDQLLKHQDHGRKDRYAADHAERNAFHHDQADVQSEAECHKAKGREAGNRSYGRSDDRLERLIDRRRHRFLRIIVRPLIFFEAVPQEYGVIHRDAQLQDCCQRLCYIRYFTEEIIGTQIINNRNSDRKQEEHRRQECVHAQRQDDGGQNDRDRHIDRLLRFRQVLGVRYDSGHSLQITAAVQELPDLGDSVHRLIRRRRRIIGNRHQRRIIFNESVSHLLRQHLLRNRDIRKAVVPQRFLNVFNFLDLLPQGYDVFVVLILDDQHRDRPCPELIHQDVLALDRLNTVRKIRQDIVVYSRV